MSCHNGPKRLARIGRPQRNIRQAEMKIKLLQILYANHFGGLDYENSYTHLTKFYELPKEDEEAIFMWLFPHSLIGMVLGSTNTDNE